MQLQRSTLLLLLLLLLCRCFCFCFRFLLTVVGFVLYVVVTDLTHKVVFIFFVYLQETE